MSKKSIGKKLSKAVAIAVITSIVFQPVAVLAEETAEKSSTVIETYAESTAKSSTEAPTSTVEQVDDANKEYVDKVESADTKVGDAEKDVQGAKAVQDDVKAASDYANEGDTNKPILADSDKISKAYDELSGAESKVGTDKNTIAGDVKNIDTKEDEATTAVSSLDSAVGDINKIANEANKTASSTIAALSEADEKIKNTGAKDATDIYEEVLDAAGKASQKLEDAVKDYQKKENAYLVALKEAEEAEQEYSNAIAKTSADISDAVANMETAKEKAAELKRQADEALKALQDAYNAEKEDLGQLEMDAKDATDEYDRIVKKVEDQEDKCEEVEGAATDAAKALEKAQDDEKIAFKEQELAKKEYDTAGKNFDREKYGVAKALNEMVSKMDFDKTETSEETLAEDLIKTYIYDMIFKGSINAKFSTLTFSDWTQTDELNTDYIKASYSKNKSTKIENRYFIYQVRNNTILIYQVKESSDSTEEAPKFKSINNVYSDEKYKTSKDEIESKSSNYLNENSEKQIIFADAEKKYNEAKEKEQKAYDDLLAAKKADSAAKDNVSQAKSALEGLKADRDKASEKATEATAAYNKVAEIDKNFKVAVEVYAKLDASAKAADEEVTAAAKKLDTLQEKINGITKMMVIADEQINISSFTARITELKKKFEEAKKVYNDAVAQKKEISDKLEIVKTSLDERLAVLGSQGTFTAGTSGGTSSGGTSSYAAASAGAINEGVSGNINVISGEQTSATFVASSDGQVLGAKKEPDTDKTVKDKAKTKVEKSEANSDITINTGATTDQNIKTDSNTENKSEPQVTVPDINPTASIIEPQVPLAPTVTQKTKNPVPLILVIIAIGTFGIVAIEIARRFRAK